MRRGKVSSDAPTAPVDTFTIRSVRTRRGVTLWLEWESTRVPIPITPA